MKTLLVDVPTTVELTPALIREALGPQTMAAAKRAVMEENRTDLARRIRQSSIPAYSDAVHRVVSAFTRFEAAKGTRDERRALAHLEATCAGLRAAEKNLKKMVAQVAPEKTTEHEEN